jgi:hypothetical protein
MHEGAALADEIMSRLESVVLIEDVLGGAKIRQKVELAALVVGHAVKIKVENQRPVFAAGIHTSIVHAEGLEKIAAWPVANFSQLLVVETLQPVESLKAFFHYRRMKETAHLLGAELHDRVYIVEESFGLQLTEEGDHA